MCWFLYPSSLVIRDLTLRSAASFGSFHLIRLLFDEYMFYLIEHRVAQISGVVPIAVIGKVRRNLGSSKFRREKLIVSFQKQSDDFYPSDSSTQPPIVTNGHSKENLPSSLDDTINESTSIGQNVITHTNNNNGNKSADVKRIRLRL